MSRTRLLVIIAGALVAVMVVGLVAMRFFFSPPADLDTARSKASEKGLYSVGIEPEAGTFTQNELHAWVLTVKAADGAAVTGATIGVDGGMPQHGHGLPTEPEASELGEGRYKIDGVRFNMSGWWELKFHITAPQGEDDVTFNITL